MRGPAPPSGHQNAPLQDHKRWGILVLRPRVIPSNPERGKGAVVGFLFFSVSHTCLAGHSSPHKVGFQWMGRNRSVVLSEDVANLVAIHLFVGW